MTTAAQVREAEHGARQARWKLRGLLVVDEAGASPEDLALAGRVRAAADPDAYDKALGDKRVNELFRRGVLKFGAAS